MNYFNIWKNYNDSRWAIICVLILAFLLISKDIITSWYFLDTIIFIVSCVIAGFVLKKIKKKREDNPAFLWEEFKKKYPIIVQYAPPKWINAAEAWLLYNLKVEPTDLTSLIYQWKYEWLIDIQTFVWKDSNKEYIKLIKKDDIPLARPLFETEIFESIFAMWNVKTIEESFQLRYALMLEDLEEHWIRKWWITRLTLSKKWEYLYNILVLLLFSCVILILSDMSIAFNILIWIIFIILLFSCIFLWWYIYWWWKFKFTDKWASLASQLIGYRNFIKSCDEKKIELLLKDDPLFIDKTLPYATAFGIETEFLNKISPLKSDRNAKYVRWQKVPSWVGILRSLIWSSDNSMF